MTFCTVEQYRAKYPESTLEDSVLLVWLEDASTMLADLLGSRYDADDGAQAATLKSVCRDVVHRAIDVESPAFGVTQWTEAANGFSESLQYSNATMDSYLTKWELARLGIGGQKLLSIEPMVEDPDD